MEKRQLEAEFRSFFVSTLISFPHAYQSFMLVSNTAQFGPCSHGPQHGFARITRWTLERAPERLHNGDVEAIFSLMDNDFTRSMWNYP